MAIDRSLILARIATIRSHVIELDRISSMSDEEFLGEPRNAAAARYFLHTSIKTMADIGNHIIAQSGWKVPASYQEAVEILTSKGVIPPARLDVYRRMMRFRNLVVHLYHQVDDRRVWTIVRDQRVDFSRFITEILDFLDQED